MERKAGYNNQQESFKNRPRPSNGAGDNNLIESQALINFCKTYNLNQIVTQPTRSADSTESLIYVILDMPKAKQIVETEVLS